MELNLPHADDAHGLHDLFIIIDHSVDTYDYEIPVKPVKPTTSVVEVHKPQLALPDAEEIIIQNMHHHSIQKLKSKTKSN